MLSAIGGVRDRGCEGTYQVPADSCGGEAFSSAKQIVICMLRWQLSLGRKTIMALLGGVLDRYTIGEFWMSRSQ